VSVDVIRNADRSDILQMFRRMNAFTLPLNAAEKRHSEFFGEFKDWVNTVLDRFGSVLIDWNILTSRQVVRMSDAEVIADIALAIEEGIVSTSPAKLLSLYRKHDKVFEARTTMDERVSGTLEVVLMNLSELQGPYFISLDLTSFIRLSARFCRTVSDCPVPKRSPESPRPVNILMTENVR
jgi:hypothetical protein